MTKQEIYKELEEGARAVKDKDGFFGLSKASVYLGDIRSNQFSRLLADTSLNVEYPVDSVFIIEITKKENVTTLKTCPQCGSKVWNFGTDLTECEDCNVEFDWQENIY